MSCMHVRGYVTTEWEVNGVGWMMDSMGIGGCKPRESGGFIDAAR